MKYAHPFPPTVESRVNVFPGKMPVTLVAVASETTTSAVAVVVTEAPDGVALAAWLLRTAVWSRGDERSTPENSQTTALPPVTVELGVMVSVVAPDTLFGAYQRSATNPATESAERAAPASA